MLLQDGDLANLFALPPFCKLSVFPTQVPSNSFTPFTCRERHIIVWQPHMVNFFSYPIMWVFSRISRNGRNMRMLTWNNPPGNPTRIMDNMYAFSQYPKYARFWYSLIDKHHAVKSFFQVGVIGAITSCQYHKSQTLQISRCARTSFLSHDTYAFFLPCPTTRIYDHLLHESMLHLLRHVYWRIELHN